MLVAENLSFAYADGNPVFASVGFSVGAGRIIGVAGHNGSGKSTLLRLCNGLLKPASGRILVDGIDTREVRASSLAGKVGTVFQSPEQQIFHSRVFDEVAFGPKRLGLSAREVKCRVEEVLDRTGMRELATAHPLDLSRTLRRFVTLASALAMKPRLLLLDEVQQGMDKNSISWLETILGKEKSGGTAVLLVSHDMEFVARNADEVLAFGDKRLLASGTPLEIFSSPDILKKAGLAVPEALQLSSLLGLPPALFAGQLASSWVRRLTEGK